MDHRPEAGASDRLSLMISLRRRLSMSPAKAWTSRILRRIRCAHFHQLYKVAVEDAGKGEESSFFCLSDELLRRHGGTPTRRHGKGFGVSSAVKDGLVELILLDQRLRPQLSKDRCREVIQDEQEPINLSMPSIDLRHDSTLTDSVSDTQDPSSSAESGQFRTPSILCLDAKDKIPVRDSFSASSDP